MDQMSQNPQNMYEIQEQTFQTQQEHTNQPNLQPVQQQNIQQYINFQPSINEISELNTLMQQSFSPDNLLQQQVYLKLQELELQNIDQLCVNLTFLFGYENCHVSVRQVAGLTLKAMTEKYFSRLQMITIEFMKKQMKDIFITNIDPSIARTISSFMALIIIRGGFNIWPELLQFLIQNIQSCQQTLNQLNEMQIKNDIQYKKNMEMIENSIHTIAIIVEDCQKLFEDVKFHNTITLIFPIVCQLINPQLSETIVQNAINTINMLLPTNTQIVLNSIDEYLSVLLKIGSSIFTLPINNNFNSQQNQNQDFQFSNKKIKWRIVQGITTIMEIKLSSIVQNYDSVSQLMLNALMHKDQQIGLAASEFWRIIIQNKIGNQQEDEIRIQKIQDNMEFILSALLECCIMSKIDQMNEMSTKEEDIGPVKQKVIKDQEDIQDDEDENQEDNYTTLRKSSAFTLQQFAQNFSEIVFVKIQAYLQNMLQSNNEDQQEAAILALGAISDQDGSYCAIEMHLDSLVPFLINKLDGKSKDVRATTCWTLSKFSEWIGNTESGEMRQQIFIAYQQKLVERMADPEESVQEAACNAYSILVETVPEKCQPYLIYLFQVLNKMVDYYKDGPLIAMFNCVGSIAQAVGEGLKDQMILETLLPLLNKKWEQFGDNNRSLLILFECFESVVFAIKDGIEPYAKNIFDRCIKILTNVLNKIKTDYENVYTEIDFYIRSMDLISSILSALEIKAQPIVFQSNLISILREFLEFRDLCIKQYVFSMIGDLQKFLGLCINERLVEFIQIAIQNLFYNDKIMDPTQNQLTVCNNACWCLGEMAVSDVNREVIKPFTDEIVIKLRDIYASKKINKYLAQNIAITLGRLGLLNPEAVANHLESIARQWCVSLRFLKSDENKERYQAYKGLCYTIARNTKGIMNDFPYFCSAIVYYKDPNRELNQIFRGMLHTFKSQCGEDYWKDYLSKFPDDLKHNLMHRYEL